MATIPMRKQKEIKPKYTIEKMVPLPATRSKYPFSKMDVGDSFLFPLSEINFIRTASYKYGVRKGRKFTVRSCFVNETGRIWRTE